MPKIAVDLIIGLLALFFGFTSARSVLQALRDGKVTAGKGATFLRSERPATFWSHVAFEALLVVVAAGALIVIAWRWAHPA